MNKNYMFFKLLEDMNLENAVYIYSDVLTCHLEENGSLNVTMDTSYFDKDGHLSLRLPDDMSDTDKAQVTIEMERLNKFLGFYTIQRIIHDDGVYKVYLKSSS